MYSKPFQNNSLASFTFLVTGGAGFIGSNIVEYLIKQGAGKIVVLDNFSTGFEENITPYLSSPQFKLIRGDIRDIKTCEDACQGVDFVFHQAALGSVPRSIKDPVTTHMVNADGFLNILVAAKNNSVRRIVYASSSSVYGDNVSTPKIESVIGNALSPYAVSKRCNELYANVFTSAYDMEIIGLRYFNIFGPRQNPAGEYAAAIPLFMNGLLHNTSVFINGDGNQSRDFTFVANAVQANIKAMFTENPKAIGEVFNIAVGEKKSVNDLFQLLKKISHSTIHPIHREDRKGDIRDSLASIDKAKELLGYSPVYKMEAGLEITYQWFKSHFSIT